MKRIFLLLLLLPVFAYAGEKYSLNQCRQLAQEHNHRARIAIEDEKTAGANRKADFTHFLPSINFSGTYLKMYDKFKLETTDITLPVVDMSGGTPQASPYSLYLPSQELEFGQDNNYLLNIGLVQPLFTGGKVMESYRISTYLENMARASRRSETSEVIYQTDRFYWQVVSLLEKQKLALKYKEMVGHHLEDLENFLAEGLITRNELLKARVKYNEADLKLLKVNNGLVLSRMALAQHIGLPLDSEPEPGDSLTIQCPYVEDRDFTSLALANRPEITLVENTVNISKSAVRLTRSRYLPDVFFTADYTYLNPNPFNSFEDEFNGEWTIGLTCIWELFHFNERGFSLTAAKHQQKARQLQLEQTEELISLDVRQAVFKTREAVNKINMTTSSLEQAEENLKITKDNFNEGLVSSTEVLDAQTLWQQANSENIDARVEYKLDLTGLQKALGTLVNR
jgi:outer membrane protein TolC